MKKHIRIIIFVLLTCFMLCNMQGCDTTGKADEIEVYFHNNLGTVVRTEKIVSGSNVSYVPNNILPEGYVFIGWDKPFNNIQQNTHFYPMYTDIRQTENAVYASSQYVNDNELVSICVQIGGNVSFACMELQIVFDNTCLVLENVLGVDADGVYHYDEQTSTIYFAMAAAQNISGGVDLLNLQFSVKEKEVESSEIILQVNDIAEFNLENELVSAKYSVFNTKIYIN